MVPGQGVSLLLYHNPLRPPEVTSIEEFWREAPLGLVATLALHGIALVDHDFGFTYTGILDPWYRWPASTFWRDTIAVVGLAGAAVGIRLVLWSCLVGPRCSRWERACSRPPPAPASIFPSSSILATACRSFCSSTSGSPRRSWRSAR